MTAEPTTPIIPAETAAHVLWSENRGGHPAGTFITKLLETWSWADDESSARLAAGWPDYAAAFVLFNQRDGIERLRAIAEGGDAL
ncbi:hypothetical protein [Streptomyces sp. NPDC058603]|uniref:hypothetical protein n=1 Tax=Streptomyces sp. NPDC058603 TaxID=3346551 RepID=UPI0036512202